MDRGALWAIVHGLTKSQTWTEQVTLSLSLPPPPQMEAGSPPPPPPSLEAGASYLYLII